MRETVSKTVLFYFGFGKKTKFEFQIFIRLFSFSLYCYDCKRKEDTFSTMHKSESASIIIESLGSCMANLIFGLGTCQLNRIRRLFSLILVRYYVINISIRFKGIVSMTE